MSSPDRGVPARSGIAWSTAAYAGGKAFSFLATLVLARLLAPPEFGVVAAILAFLVLVELVSDLGMKANLIYEQEQGLSGRLQTAFTINLAFAALLCAAGVALAPLVAAFFDLEGRTDLFRLAALNILLTAFGNVHDAVLVRGLDFRRRIKPELARAGVRGCVAVALAVAGLGASAIVIGMLAGTAVWVVVQWVLTPLRPTLAFDRAVARSMARYGSDAAVLEVLAVVVSRIDIAVIGNALGARALGIYSLAQRVPELLIDAVTWNIAYVSFPALSRERARAEGGSVREGILAFTRWQALYALPLATATAVLATPMVVVLFSDTWRDAGPVLAALAALSAILAIAFPAGTALRATGRQRILIAIAAIQIPILVGGLIAAADHGITAVGWTRTGIAGLYLAMMLLAAARVLDVSPRAFARALGPAIAGALGVGAGAGAVRLGWTSDSAPALIAGLAAAAAGGALTLRLLAPAQAREALAVLAGLLAERRQAR